MLGSGRKQEASNNNNNNLEHQVNHDASYQRTVKGQALADPNKEALTLQGTIGILAATTCLARAMQAHAISKSPASCSVCELNAAVKCAMLHPLDTFNQLCPEQGCLQFRNSGRLCVTRCPSIVLVL